MPIPPLAPANPAPTTGAAPLTTGAAEVATGAALPPAPPRDALVVVRQLQKFFPRRRDFWGRVKAWKKAVNAVDFFIQRGETYALVGESGCGKTTTGRCVLRLIKPTAGEVFFSGRELTHLSPAELTPLRRHLQMIFQDPYSSLNSRFTAGAIVGEGWEIHGIYPPAERAARLTDLFVAVGLAPEHIHRYPHEFSGGQRQRLGLARALALAPDFIVCDEPVSALDVSIQAQIINLLRQFRDERGLAYLFISHDLAVVRYLAHRVGVMFAGELIEEAPTDELFAHPLHPYTQILLSAIPEIEVQRRRQRLFATSEAAPAPQGCAFAPRCPRRQKECSEAEITPVNYGAHRVKCRVQ
jgi:oligopeptide/dipeptide ABC transporter ATP-binding protein